MLHFCLYQYQGNEGAEEIYVTCKDNKDLAEVILKDMKENMESFTKVAMVEGTVALLMLQWRSWKVSIGALFY